MSHSGQPETRRFTRALCKPGTAAELRQSVSEVVRASVLLVSGRDRNHTGYSPRSDQLHVGIGSDFDPTSTRKSYLRCV
ncbi:dedicator of cytokinesis protein 9-like isoform X1 [Arapaima gigas]